MHPVHAGKLIPIGESFNGHIVAAGPITKQPGTRAYRIVLTITLSGEYTVHTQSFDDSAKLEKSDFSNGHYFGAGPKQFQEAIAKFSEKVAKHAEFCSSIYREQVA